MRAPASTSPEYVVQIEDERDSLRIQLAQAETALRHHGLSGLTARIEELEAALRAAHAKPTKPRP